MGLFNNLMSKLFSHAPAPVLATATPAVPQPVAASQSAAAGPSVVAAVAPPPVPKPAMPVVDVAAILDGLAAKNSEDLDWKRSIVDLMKLVGMDSSLSSRKELATDLRYTGDQSDSASMNIWLHKEVLKKLSENGGKVPPELLS